MNRRLVLECRERMNFRGPWGKWRVQTYVFPNALTKDGFSWPGISDCEYRRKMADDEPMDWQPLR